MNQTITVNWRTIEQQSFQYQLHAMADQVATRVIPALNEYSITINQAATTMATFTHTPSFFTDTSYISTSGTSANNWWTANLRNDWHVHRGGVNYDIATADWRPWRHPRMTEEEIRAQREAEARRNEEYRAHRELVGDALLEAEAKARELFLAVLTDEQRAEHAETSKVTVCSRSGNRYRIHTGSVAGNVERIDHRGRVTTRYCAHLYQADMAPVVLGDDKEARIVSQFDNALAQMLALQFDEDAFLRVANPTHYNQPMVVA